MTGSEQAMRPSERTSSIPAAAPVPLLERRDVMVVGVMSESHVDGEEEAAGWREGSEVDETADRLVAEVAHLGIGAGILGPGQQIASAELHFHGTRPSREPVDPRPRDIVRERHFA